MMAAQRIFPSKSRISELDFIFRLWCGWAFPRIQLGSDKDALVGRFPSPQRMKANQI